MLIPFFPMLAVLTGNPIVYFVIVAVLIAVALYYTPTLLPMDASVWKVIRIVVIIALILWALSLFGLI